MPANACRQFRPAPQSGNGRRPRGSLFIWMAALFAAVVLTACVIINPPPAPTPTPVPTATPTRQTVIDVVRVAEGGDPPVIGQTVKVALTLDEDTYTDRSRWQWERSDDGLTGWIAVPGARLTDSSLYAPVAADEGKYLRASVSYVDSDDEGKTALSPTVGPVVTAEIDTETVEFAFGNDPAVVSRAVRARLTLSDSDYSELGRWRWDRSDKRPPRLVRRHRLRRRRCLYLYPFLSRERQIPPRLSRLQGFRRKLQERLEPDHRPRRLRRHGRRRGRILCGGPTRPQSELGSRSNSPSPIATTVTSVPGKWERSNDGLGKWQDITDYDASNSARYTPTGADEGKYLRASALYVDSEDERKRALSQTIGPVVE